MLQRVIDDLQNAVGNAVRLSSFAIGAAVSLFVTTGFLAAAALMFVLPREGPVAACFAGGAVFFAVALLAVAGYAMQKRQEAHRLEQAAQAAKEAAQSAKSAASTLMSDPAAIAIGLQLVRMVGIRRLVPILAFGGVALGFMFSQRHRRDADHSQSRGSSPATD